MKALFVELPAFARHRADYFDDNGFRGLQNVLLDNPEAGEVIAGTSGLRKVGYTDARRGKGNEAGIECKEKSMKRNVFSELTEGFDALKAEREGKTTLRTHAVKRKPAAVVTSSAWLPSDETPSGNIFRIPHGSKLP